MKRKLLLLAALLLAGGLFLRVASTYAHENEANASQAGTIDHTLYRAGDNVDITGTVNGDVYCAGQHVHITGTVTGDVICAGFDVVIDARVLGDIRAAGQKVSVNGEVGKNVSLFGETISVNKSAKIGGDVLAAGTTVSVAADVQRDVTAHGNSVTLDGRVGRNANGSMTTLALGPTANILGDLQYTSEKEVSRASGSAARGEVNRTIPEKKGRTNMVALGGAAFVLMFVALLLVSLTLVILFPELFERTSIRIANNTAGTTLTGLALLVCAPIGILLIGATIVGIPLAGMVLLGLFLMMMLSGPVAAYYLGGRLLASTRKSSPFVQMLVGSIVLLVLYGVPVLGFIALLWAGFTGSGAAFGELFGSKKTVTHSKKPA